MPDGTPPRPPAYRPPPLEPRPITGSLAVQFEPRQMEVNLAGLRRMMQALGAAPRSLDGEHPRAGAVERLSQEIYVGERAWCAGHYDPLFDESWDRAPEEVSPERASCAFVAVVDAPKRASCT